MIKPGNIVFFNGQLTPEREVGISIHDRGFIYSDAVFDATRTFNGKTFKLREHIDRLYNSLRYLRINPGMDKDEMEHWSEEVVKHNYPLLSPNQDLWVMQRISRGVESSEPGYTMRPTVLIETHALPLCPPGFPLPGRHPVDNAISASGPAPVSQPPGQDSQLPQLGSGRLGSPGH
jgi:hypothetical protein